MKSIIIFTVLLLQVLHSFCQDKDSLVHENARQDSIFIAEVEEKKVPAKVLHAEPLFIDLIRDLGARKGEKEWNLGIGLTDNNRYDRYTALVEYEFAPIDRLGLEIEMPFSFFYPTMDGVVAPKSKLNSLKLAGQYSFYVSEKKKMSAALGYIHEFELTGFSNYGKSRFYTGNIFNPFLVLAKRWNRNFHTLLYTGPLLISHFGEKGVNMRWQINSNIHYMIPGTRNFIGIEFNKEAGPFDFDMVIRPQMRVAITGNMMAGIVTGIPISRENERFSSFLRLIYEPVHRRPKL